MRSKQLALCFIGFFVVSFSAFPVVRLPRLISDGLILQRDADTRIWGFADPKEKVTVTFKDKQYSTKADANGDWDVVLPPTPWDGTSYTIQVNELKVKDVVFGDVWVFSGQSNMQTLLERTLDIYGRELSTYTNPLIREFYVPEKYAYDVPQKDCQSGQWTAVTPESCLKMSIVPYFFAKKIFETYQVPVAIVQCAVGGTAIESWMSPDNLSEYAPYMDALERLRQPRQQAQGNQNGQAGQLQGGQRPGGNQGQRETPMDEGLTGAYYKLDYDDASWKSIGLPHYWKDTEIGMGRGSVYYRHYVYLTAQQAASANNELKIGTINNADEAYINGQKVGSTSYQYPPRNYRFGSGILKEGPNVIAIKVTGSGGSAGFLEDKKYCLRLEADTIQLTEGWKYKPGDFTAMNQRPVIPARPEASATNVQRPVERTTQSTQIRMSTQQPFGLYYGMLRVVSNMTVKGVAWYQGETNAGNADNYALFLTRMMNTWRNDFRNPSLPVLVTQLHSHLDRTTAPVQDGWANLREQQRLAVHQIPGSALAVGCDVGEFNDIHPLNKKPIALRLAKAAQRLAYGETVVLSPECTKAELKDGRLYLSFSEIGNGLVLKGTEIKGFAVAGADGQYQKVAATLIGNRVVLYVAGVKDPTMLRYLWKNFAADDVTLYNAEGMPVTPFEMVLAPVSE